MTLKTYHFSSIASMNVTLGVPLMEEIVNAPEVINTPIITRTPVAKEYERGARTVKGRMEMTYLEAVGSPPLSIHSGSLALPLTQPHKIIPEGVCSRDDDYFSILLDQGTISEPQLEPTTYGTVITVVKCKRKIIRQDIRMIRNKIRI